MVTIINAVKLGYKGAGYIVTSHTETYIPTTQLRRREIILKKNTIFSFKPVFVITTLKTIDIYIRLIFLERNLCFTGYTEYSIYHTTYDKQNKIRFNLLNL